MSGFDNTNRGVLFISKNKRSDRSPDYSGDINIDGITYFLSGWKQKARSGITYLSLSVGDVKEGSKAKGVPEQRKGFDDFPEDDLTETIPF